MAVSLSPLGQSIVAIDEVCPPPLLHGAEQGGITQGPILFWLCCFLFSPCVFRHLLTCQRHQARRA